MSPDNPPTDGMLPDLAALASAATEFGLQIDGARLLHHRSNAVYLLPHDNVVARLAPATPVRVQRAETAIAVTRWLAEIGENAALPPLDGPQPVIAGGAVATFLPYRPNSEPPSLGDLASTLRRLHTATTPPFPLPAHQPLTRLIEALALDAARTQPILDASAHTWLRTRIAETADAYARTEFPLGHGLIHNDAHTENLLHDGRTWVLIDWDQACYGPRELDLRTALPDHFHEPADDRRRFLDAYGYDLLAWPEWPLLRDITELHSLGSYIRLAPTKPAAAAELRLRLSSLQKGDRSVQWHAVS
jgi:Ser/Thr protein kinase RdoA (MazF antagonist)